MFTVRREIPPEGMESGEKLLFISAGSHMICALTVCPVIAVEKINPPRTSRDKIDLFIFPLHNIQLVPGIKKRNRRRAVGFAIGSPLPYPYTGFSDQTGSGSKHPQTNIINVL
jgi:hypothetical protein